jgi:hypothetical protein
LQNERWLDITFDAKDDNEFFEEGHILVDADQFIIEDPILEHTLIKA